MRPKIEPRSLKPKLWSASAPSTRTFPLYGGLVGLVLRVADKEGIGYFLGPTDCRMGVGGGDLPPAPRIGLRAALQKSKSYNEPVAGQSD